MSDLTYKQTNVIEKLSPAQVEEMEGLCKDYRVFLDEGKTERECVDITIKMAEANGFKNVDSVTSLKAGDKVYKINRNKNRAQTGYERWKKCRITRRIYQILRGNICFDWDFCFGNDTVTSYSINEFICCVNKTRAQNEQIMRNAEIWRDIESKNEVNSNFKRIC